jgi:hypothetical protein
MKKLNNATVKAVEECQQGALRKLLDEMGYEIVPAGVRVKVGDEVLYQNSVAIVLPQRSQAHLLHFAFSRVGSRRVIEGATEFAGDTIPVTTLKGERIIGYKED